MSLAEFQKQMYERGWYLFEDVICPELVSRMLVDLENSYVKCREIQIKNGLDKTEGTAHHLIGHAQSFMDCLAEYEKLDEYFTSYFGGKYILNSFGGNILKQGMSYANEIHRDIRSFSGSLPLMLNTLVFLDDFTHENGATWLMGGGHRREEKPNDDMFNYDAFQITGKAGSLAVWSSNLWHRAGINTTDMPRRSVTPELSLPYYKPGFDYPRVLGYHMGDSYSPYLQQVLGYNHRIPATLEQWYQKPDHRFYKGEK